MLEAKETSEMWQVLKSLTDNKPNNNTHTITDNGRACMSQSKKANAFMNMYKSVSSLNFTKEDWGVKRILNRTLRTLEVNNGNWSGLATSENRADFSNLNPSKAADPDKIHRSYNSFSKNPGSHHPSHTAGGSLTRNRPQRAGQLPFNLPNLNNRQGDITPSDKQYSP